MTLKPKALYEDDFFAWTQEQAALLRRLRPRSNRLDPQLIAEEIEALGKSELRSAQSLCEHIIERLLKLEYSGHEEPAEHWRAEIVERRLQLERPSLAALRQSSICRAATARHCGCCAGWNGRCPA